VPPEIARWNAERKELVWKLPLQTKDIVHKRKIGHFGVGDGCIKYGVDFKTEHDVEAYFAALNTGACAANKVSAAEVLALERVLPGDLGYHNFDIVTMKRPDGEVMLLRAALYHGAKTYDAAHSATNKYLLDPISEKIICREQFNRQRGTCGADPAMIGRVIPGLKAICDQAIKNHQALMKTNNAFTTVGWDAMITEDQRVVWFEGNKAARRVGRFILSSWGVVFKICDLLG
jgi:hypothetical protein